MRLIPAVCAAAIFSQQTAFAQAERPIDGLKDSATRVAVPRSERAPLRGGSGPTARHLNSLGDNVPVPKSPLRERPVRQVEQKPRVTSPSPILPRNLPSSEDQRTEIGRSPAGGECLSKLQGLALAFSVPQPAANDGACTIPQPVRLDVIKGKPGIKMSKGLVLDCPFALRYARFLRDTVQPLAQFHLGAPLRQIGSGKGFICRRRNNAATGKLSEHAFGNAIDLVTFTTTDGLSVQVQDGSTLERGARRFQRAIRTAACGHFTTVLGPGSNAAHATHLHLDLGRSKDRKNPYRICE